MILFVLQNDTKGGCGYIISDGEYLIAQGTTLGGDDGIAVAYILALLDDDTLAHPPVEALLTADEEIGLRGAGGLDASRLTAKRLINIDSEEEGVLTVSCAGGIRVVCDFPVSWREAESGMTARKVICDGLVSGHSGIDIGKGLKNAAKVLAEFLYDLHRSQYEKCPYAG